MQKIHFIKELKVNKTNEVENSFDDITKILPDVSKKEKLFLDKLGILSHFCQQYPLLLAQWIFCSFFEHFQKDSSHTMKWGQIRALFFCSLCLGLFVYVYVKPSTVSSKQTKKLLTKAILQNSFSKIHWNLNGMNQNDPILIQTIKKYILIPSNQPKQPLTL